MILVLFLALFVLQHHADGYAADQICSGWGSWIRGGPYNQMQISTYSTSTTACTLSLSPSATTYNAGQQFTVTINAPSRLGLKVVTTGGAVISSAGSGGLLDGTECANFRSKRTSGTVILQAPTRGGEIRVKALCGTNEKAMHVATDLVLQPGPDVLPSVADTSSDPNYDFQKSLAGNVLLFFSKNESHVKVKLDYAAIGYVSLGIGSAMVGTAALVGLSPSSNAGKPAVGLYDLVSKSLTSATTLRAESLQTLGIEDAQYQELGQIGHSVLSFSLRIGSQTVAFPLFNANSGTDLNWAVGPSALGMHTNCGVVLGLNFVSGSSTTSNNPPPTNTGGGGTVSTDPSYDYMAPLKPELTLFYKKNATHGMVKLKKTTPGYLSLGIGRNMIGAVALIGMDPQVNPGYASIGVYSLLTKNENPNGMQTLAETPTTLYNLYGISNQTFSGADLTFVIELAKQDPSFTLFPSASAGVDLCYAGGPVNGQLLTHPLSGVWLGANLATGGGFSSTQEVNRFLLVHVILMLLAWAFLFPLISLTKKRCRCRNPTHIGLATLGLVLSLLGFAISVYYTHDLNSSHFVSSHAQLGLAVVLLSIVQPTLGVFRSKLEYRTFQRVHSFVGISLLLLGLTCCLLGVVRFEAVLGGTGSTYAVFGEVDYAGFTGKMGQFVAVVCAFWLLFIFFHLVSKQFAVSPSAKQTSAMMSSEPSKEISVAEFNSPPTRDIRYVVCNGSVYNIAPFLKLHPGGESVLLQAGKDISAPFNDKGHSRLAYEQLAGLLVGHLPNAATRGTNPPMANPKADCQLSRNFSSCLLMEKKNLTPNVVQLTFALPNKAKPLGLPVGKHVQLQVPNPSFQHPTWNSQANLESTQKAIARNYTPVSSTDEKGIFTLVCKIYRPSRAFPDGGRMGRVLDTVQVGESMLFAGPFGSHSYLGAGKFSANNKETAYSEIACITGGSGITPVYQIVRAALKDREIRKVSIIYCNSTVNDVLLQKELEALENKYSSRLSVWYTVSQTPSTSWKYSIGRINATMVKDHFPLANPGVLVISSGPKALMHTSEIILRDAGFTSSQMVEY